VACRTICIVPVSQFQSEIFGRRLQGGGSRVLHVPGADGVSAVVLIINSTFLLSRLDPSCAYAAIGPRILAEW